MLKVDQGPLHVDPHGLGPVLLEYGLAIGWADRLRVLPGDVASGKKQLGRRLEIKCLRALPCS